MQAICAESVLCENRTIYVTFLASRFVEKLLSTENPMLPIPMPGLELVVSDLWPAIAGN